MIKKKNISSEIFLDKLEFYKIEPGEYLDLGYLEEVDEKEIQNLTHGKKVSLPNGNTGKSDDLKHLYAFARFRLTEGFELADTLVPQSFFAQVIGFNPSDGQSAEKNFFHHPTNASKIKYKLKAPVTGVTEKILREFLIKVNDKKIQKSYQHLLKLTNNGLCILDIPSEKQYDFLKYQWLKDVHFFKNKNALLEDSNILNLNELYSLNQIIQVRSVNFDFTEEKSFYFELVTSLNTNLNTKSNKEDNNGFVFFDKNQPDEVKNSYASQLFSRSLIVPLGHFFRSRNYVSHYDYFDLDSGAKVIDNHTFKGFLGVKKVFVKDESDERHFVLTGIDPFAISDDNGYIDLIKTLFRKDAYIDTLDGNAITFDIKQFSTQTDPSYNAKTKEEEKDNSLSDNTPKDVEKKYYRQSISENPESQSILLIRKCH